MVENGNIKETQNVQPNRITRFFNFFRNINNKPLTPDVQLAYEIFIASLENPENIFLLNTELSGEKYIYPKSFYEKHILNTGTCVILDSHRNNLKIVNHKYQYDVPIPEKIRNELDNRFIMKIEEERQKLKTEVLNNTTRSLEIVLKSLK